MMLDKYLLKDRASGPMVFGPIGKRSDGWERCAICRNVKGRGYVVEWFAGDASEFRLHISYVFLKLANNKIPVTTADDPYGYAEMQN